MNWRLQKVDTYFLRQINRAEDEDVDGLKVTKETDELSGMRKQRNG